MNADRVVVIGDSHSSFFTGQDAIAPPYPEEPIRWGPYEVFHLGPGLASSLVERESTNATRAKAFDVLSRFQPGECAAVLLCFGEIDCRFHVQRRAEKAPIDFRQAMAFSVKVSAYRYMSFVLEVLLRGFRPVVFGPVATSEVRFDPPYEWPTLGTTEERNTVTRDFDEHMRRLCHESGIGYISLLRHLTDRQLRTQTGYFFDGVHLSRAAWPLFESESRKSVPDLASALVTGNLAESAQGRGFLRSIYARIKDWGATKNV